MQRVCPMQCSIMHWLPACRTALSVGVTGDVLLPGNQLCDARAAWASALAHAGSKHGACHLARRSPSYSSTYLRHHTEYNLCLCTFHSQS